jgi:hypothetical protein
MRQPRVRAEISVCSGAILVLAVAASICGAVIGRIRSCAARRPSGSVGRLREWSAHQASRAAEKAPAPGVLLSSTSLIAASWNEGAAASGECSAADLDDRLWRPRNAWSDRQVEGARAVGSISALLVVTRLRRSAAAGQACRSVDLSDGFLLGSPALAATER